jgi:hypothetical protein
MTMEKWEGSAADKKHDRAARADGGKVHAGKGKGKTNITIVVGGPPGGAQAPMPPAAPPPRMPLPIPVSPPPGAPPMGAPPPGLGAPPMGAPPMMRARGGKVGEGVNVKAPGRTSEGYPKMDYASLGGKGRLQKVKAYGSKPQ